MESRTRATFCTQKRASAGADTAEQRLSGRLPALQITLTTLRPTTAATCSRAHATPPVYSFHALSCSLGSRGCMGVPKPLLLQWQCAWTARTPTAHTVRAWTPPVSTMWTAPSISSSGWVVSDCACFHRGAVRLARRTKRTAAHRPPYTKAREEKGSEQLGGRARAHNVKKSDINIAFV